MSNPPVIRSYHEYTQHLEEALSFVRCLLHLSRKHEYLVRLDKQMSRCWNTSVNCNVPDEDDRKACAQSIGAIEVGLLRESIMPAMRAMVPLAQHCQGYFDGLPLAPGDSSLPRAVCTDALCRCENRAGATYCRRCGARLPQTAPARSGWALPSQMVHGDEIISDLRTCIDDCKCLKRLAPEDELFQFLDEQIQKMARFTRESVLPSAVERAELQLQRVSADEMSAHVEGMFQLATDKLAGFSHLYVNFPTDFFG